MQRGAEEQPPLAAAKLQPQTNGKEEELESDAETMEAELQEEEAEFNWEEYMEEKGAVAAPHNIFKHVEISLQSSFQPGMKLEVANRGRPDTFWVATIVTTCGQLLLLRFSGFGRDRRADFWCDVMAAELHPVGWCAQNHKTLMPPEAIQEKYQDWTHFLVQDLTGARTAPASLLEGPLRGKNTVDLIVEGSLLELQDPSDPFLYWPVRVQQNVGGRLCLRYAGLSPEQRDQDSWIFYLDGRLRPLGWALENQLSLEPPSALRSLNSAARWQEALEEARGQGQENPLPLEVFKDHRWAELPRHAFRTGMKLEMVSPWEPLRICPASVTKVYDQVYFQVTLDDLSDGARRSVVRHAGSPGILPVQWCLKNGVGLERPPGGADFDWADYLKLSGSEAAPDGCFPAAWQSRGFAQDMWLEAVNPQRPAEVCVAQVTQVRGRLLWLRLEGVPKPLSEIIVDVESTDIFPVGWCEANGCPLTPPLRALRQRQRKVAVIQPEKQLTPPPPLETAAAHCQPAASDAGAASGRYGCSKVFVNHRCFSGPYLNKGRLAELPQAVGPGKCVLVLKELLSMLINAAYKPGRVLKELQDLQDPGWDCQEETLKAKYKGKTYRSALRVVRLADQVPDFCRRVCVKLQCCPNLLGPAPAPGPGLAPDPDPCPHNCSVQTKTKYTYYYGKKRKLSRLAPGGEAPGSQLAKPARRKKRKSIFVQKKRRSAAADFTPADSPQDSDEDDRTPPPSGSEGTGSEPRDDHTDASSVETAAGRRPRRAAALRRTVGREAPEGRRRSTRSLTNSKQEAYQPGEGPAPLDGDEGQLVLDSNPLQWTVDQVVRFIRSTDCASLAGVFQEQDVDGQALLLLTLPTVQDCMELKLGPAIKLCHQVERLKAAFYRQFAG